MLDPDLLAIPDPAAGTAEVQGWVRCLRHWFSILGGHEWARILVSHRTTQALERAGAWPVHQDAEQLLAKCGLKSVYSPNDICTAVNGVLDRADRIEDTCGVSDALAANVTLEPSARERGLHPALADALEDVVLLASLAAEYKTGDLHIYQLAIRGERGTCSTVSIRARVDMVDPDGALGCEVELPVQLHAKIVAVADISSSASSIDPRLIWGMASDPSNVHTAILLKAWRIMRDDNRNLELGDVPKFAIGPEFVASLTRASADGSKKYATATLEACARVLAQKDTGELHPFREDANPTAPQRARARDGALAFRLQIAKRHEAPRLMLWRCRDGSYEFANVGVKRELLIKE